MPEPEQPPDPDLPPLPERPKLPEDVVDAPLVRIYNFLRKYSLYPLYSHSSLSGVCRDYVNVIPVRDILVPGVFFESTVLT
jgi:hypothetical protein